MLSMEIFLIRILAGKSDRRWWQLWAVWPAAALQKPWHAAGQSARVRTHNHDGGVPANVGTNSSLEMFVARKPWFVFG